MTAGTVVITGGILATVILLCIIAVLCYCRLQYYCCKKEESESEEEEPDFAVTSRLPPVHSNHNIVAAAAAASSAVPNGPALFTTPPLARKLTRSQTICPSCTHYELPFYLQPAPPHTYHQPHPDGLRNGGERLSFRGGPQELDLPVPVSLSSYRKNHLTRAVTMRDMFTRSCSISTDV
ncbi:protein FAM163B [Gadus morhua]|uniref:protein FAM163B n=1 Tax=Gadus morhua TaxID=8049 RepID=UPI0011B5CEF2|nr:protein FAM163B [Gadus morhua]